MFCDMLINANVLMGLIRHTVSSGSSTWYFTSAPGLYTIAGWFYFLLFSGLNCLTSYSFWNCWKTQDFSYLIVISLFQCWRHWHILCTTKVKLKLPLKYPAAEEFCYLIRVGHFNFNKLPKLCNLLPSLDTEYLLLLGIIKSKIFLELFKVKLYFWLILYFHMLCPLLNVIE